MNAQPGETNLRRFLLLLSLLALLTTLAELWLENHTQELLQWIPWVLCAIGLLALLPTLLRPGRATLSALRVAMVVVAIGGVVGIFIHLKENVEFEQQIRANVAFIDALLAGIKGTAPLLAPGSLTFAALIAIAGTYHHPALETRALQRIGNE
jgi:hypothetical protein